MNKLYVERVLALRPDRSAFEHVSGDELELNKLLVTELSNVLKRFNPNHDIEKLDLLQLAYGICLQVNDNKREINNETGNVEWLSINDILKTISIYSMSNVQSTMAMCMAMHILSLQRKITDEACLYADLLKEYCSQSALDSKIYKYFCSLSKETSMHYEIDWTSFMPSAADLSELSHSAWNTITHGFSMEMVESWINLVDNRGKLLEIIISAFEENVRQRKITEEQNDIFDW